MAADTRRRGKPKRKRKNILLSLFIKIAAVCAAVYCTYSIINDRADIAETQAILDSLYAEADSLRAENTSYQSIIDEDDERAYMERIAIEVLGYAYPSERRFYDTTRS